MDITDATGITNAAGPGSVSDTGIAPKPLLEGASEYEYVEILNPLSVDFIGLFAMTRPVMVDITVTHNPAVPPSSKTPSDVIRNYGLDLKNQDHVGKANIQSRITIPAGRTLNILGNEAQVIVRQLVNEIMQREGNKLMLADPFQRNLVETRIIRSRRSVADLLGNAPISVQQQVRTALDTSNQTDEFPGLKENHEENTGIRPQEHVAASTDSRGETVQPAKRNPGRPKRTE